MVKIGRSIDKERSLIRIYIAYEKAESQKAIEYFHGSFKLDLNHPPTYYNLADIYTEIDSQEVALKYTCSAYKRYKFLNYKNEACLMTGSILGKLERYEEAISVILNCDCLTP